eukprot:scaffold269890_cov39-Tisochrysis_lutea.AAC.1
MDATKAWIASLYCSHSVPVELKISDGSRSAKAALYSRHRPRQGKERATRVSGSAEPDNGPARLGLGLPKTSNVRWQIEGTDPTLSHASYVRFE